MVLILHIIFALSGVIFATYLLFRPTKKIVTASNSTAALTFVSGTYLVLSTQSNILKACLTGIAYFSFVLVATYFANNKIKSTN